MLDVVLTDARNVHSVPLQVSYDKAALEVIAVSNGGFLSQNDKIVALVRRDDPAGGITQISASRPQDSDGASGHGVVMTLTFRAKAQGQFPVTITKGAIIPPDKTVIDVTGSQVSVNVR